ncbi:MAG TPA: NAD-dependent epimerase/dehydratase family protein [Coriobacteriia bacterium]|nr:NAD-dependent epimerase/dehydratase family protein [Coriobacteriia bacterium]
MRIMVTGGAGFIGSNLVWTLVGAGHDVLVIDDMSTGRVENLHPASSFRTLDILAPELAGVLAEFAPDVVVHLAAQTSVPASVADPEHDWTVNVEGTRAVARAAVAANVKRVLSASSAAVYGEPAVIPLPETAEKSPINPYGRSKLAAESVLAEELRGTATDFASFRFANVYGPRQDWQGEGGVVAIFTAKMHANEAATVYGSGLQTRDFIYVGDIVGGILDAIDAEVPLAGAGEDGPAYNLSTGTRLSVNELVAHVRSATRYAGEIVYADAREGDIEHSALDPTKAHETFGFLARVPVDVGIAQTVKWFARRS